MPAPLVRLLCARCSAPLAPAFGGRLRCPRLSACGYGGPVEDGKLLARLQASGLPGEAAA